MANIRVLLFGIAYEPPVGIGRRIHVVQPYIVHMQNEQPDAGYSAWVDAESANIIVTDAVSENEPGMTDDERVRFDKFWDAAIEMTKAEHITNTAQEPQP